MRITDLEIDWRGLKFIGLTGTQRGMTEKQRDVVRHVVSRLVLIDCVAVHGDCMGADAQFDTLARERGLYRIIYPGHGRDGQSGTRQHSELKRGSASVHDPLPYLERDKIIAARVDLLLATPKGYLEELRSGTWATIRYRRKSKKDLVIIWPDGTAQFEAGERRQVTLL